MKRVALFAGLAASAWMLSACVDANNRLTIGDDLKLEALYGPQPLVESETGPAPAAAFIRPDDAPSVTSLNRDNWEGRTLEVPVDYTRHRPHYRIPWQFADRTARERGEAPTAETALELDCRSGGQHGREGLAAPFIALMEGLSIPVRLFTDPQCNVWRSPDVPYGRAPRPAPTIEREPGIAAVTTDLAPAPGPALAQPAPAETSTTTPVPAADSAGQPASNPTP